MAASKRTSAGLLMYRRRAGALEVLVVHPGGPFFAKKDAGWWTIPKGLVAEGEEPLAAARREFEEETSFAADAREYLPLGEVKQKGGKTVVAWAFEGDCDAAACASNAFRVEWPPKSGAWQSFPEVDRAEWLSPDEARRKLNAAQTAFVDRLVAALGG